MYKEIVPNLEIAAKFQFLFKPKRIKVMYGGRGGAKTISIVRAILTMSSNRAMRILCLREFMNSIEDSVHSAFSGEIDKLGLASLYNVKANSIDCTINDSIIRYGQLSRNIASLKSKYDFDIAWVEEAETVTSKSLETLIPTFRKPGSEIWMSFNPDDENGAVYDDYVKPYLNEIQQDGFYEDEDVYVVKVGLEDNPFAPQELIDSSAKMKKDNFKRWLHIYGGECFADYDDSIIQPEWVEAAIDAHVKIPFQAVGVKCLGFDPADSGKDAKALCIRHGSVITHAEEWTHGELPDAINIAFDTAHEKRCDTIVYDADGLGAGVKVGLEQRLEGKNISVEPYRGGSSVDYPHTKYMDATYKNVFKNKRAQYWWLLRDRFEATYNAVENGIYTDPEKMISLSSDLKGLSQLKTELIKLQRKRTNNSIIQIESKQDMKSRGFQSPNISDALVYCFANKPAFDNYRPPIETFSYDEGAGY